MSESNIRVDISVELSKHGSLLCAQINFNLIKTTLYVEDSDLGEFLKKFERVVNSTFEQVIPHGRRSSADIIDFQPKTIYIFPNEEVPPDKNELDLIHECVYGIERAWEDARNIF